MRLQKGDEMAMSEQDLAAAETNRRPYAAAANVVAVLQRCRTRNLPEVIDNDFFQLVEVPGVVFGRVRDALRFLELVDPDGRPTDTLQAIAASSDEEYRELLAATIRRTYSGDFERVNPSEDTQAQIVNAFRRYEPRSQTNRMVMLFLGLCREAGIPVLDAPRDRQMRAPSARAARPTRRQTPPSGRRQGASHKDVLPPGGHSLTPTGLLFGVTEEDAGLLSDAEFEEVWSALGRIARARAQARQQAKQPSPTGKEGSEEEVSE
jgi:hypothetical protein